MASFRQRKPTAIDLFSGPGGMTQGLRSAGFRVVAAVEIDPLAVATFRTNHRGVRVWHSDVRDLDPFAVASAVGLRAGELGLLGGCPPCQGFSSTRTLNGAYRVRDRRNSLVDVFISWVKALRPRAVLLENVPGLMTNWRYPGLIRELEKLHYRVNNSAGILDAMHYGVPQRRRRLVVMGVRGARVSFAEPVAGVVTVREALRGVGPAGASGDPLHDLPENRSVRISKLIAAIPKNGGSRSSLDDALVLACHRETDGFKDVYGRMAWDKPAPTITGGCFNPSKGRFLHPEENRAITLREAALLQGFPPGYAFALDRGKQAVAAMIGNALPPPFVEAQARVLAAAINLDAPRPAPAERKSNSRRRGSRSRV